MNTTANARANWKADDATISYLQGCVDSKDDELFRVKGVRNELQDKCDALAAENARLAAELSKESK